MRSHLGHSLCILFGIIWHRVLVAENLTSLLPVSTSARPTTMHSTITVPDEKSSVTVDILANKNYRRIYKDPAAEIWKWDYWCLLQPKKGDCKLTNLTKYYYLPRLDQCEPFKYSGCNGNKNQFSTKQECESHCLGSGLMYQEKVEQYMACMMQPSGGACLGYMTRQYYDINKSRCTSFLYSGCGGNGNNFELTADCMRACHENAKNREEKIQLRKSSESSSDEERL